ncbi:MAG: homocysteine S-methyltransferase family protein, partial [Clostridia bacterium]|nr:homocysteine S-methyltransferase family protein [Clostridia bacterium]
MKILDFIKQNIVLLDGATGSLLQKRGLPAGVKPETANITDPHLLIDIHREYYDAGSNIVNTNTFGANTLSFTEDELERIIQAAILNVKTAARLSTSPQEKFVSYDMGPTGKLLKPYGDLEFEKAVEIFGIQARLAEKYGADLISIETMNDGYETKAALLAVKENCSLPVFVTNAYGEDGRLLTGASPEAMVALLEGMGADAIGLNCSYGPDRLAGVIRKILRAASVPVIFKPNAGLPEISDGATVYDISPETFAKYLTEAVDEGVNIIGGCCGTTPEYIEKLRQGIEGKTRIPEKEKNLTVVSSYSHEVVFGDRPVIVGERINPTGKKLIKQALTENNIDFLLKEGREQQKKGADILDVNCGLPEIDEKAMLTETVGELQAVCDLPLQIDTSDYGAMESALRIYNGKAVINSVNGKAEVMKAVFPLAAKYGGVIVALTLDEDGIPPDAAGCLEIARRIIAVAEEYGIKKKNLIFDPLTMTVSTDSSAAQTTLDSVRMISEKTGCKTILGVSNVSFGLPQRSRINSFFFALAM